MAEDEILKALRRTVAGEDVDYVLSRSKVVRETGMGFGYSIMISNSRGESITAPDVTSDEQSAREVFDKLYQGTVTPATFMDVVEDWLVGRALETSIP